MISRLVCWLWGHKIMTLSHSGDWVRCWRCYHLMRMP